MTARRLTSLLALALVGQACSFADSAGSVMNVCSMASDCGDDERCDADLGACISRQGADYEVIVRVTAPSTETNPASPPTRFGPYALEEPVSSRTLTVQGTRAVSGLVAIRGADGDRPLAAELLFEPQGNEPGPDAEVLSVNSSSEQRADAALPTNFQTTLRVEAGYEVTVVPSGEAITLVPERTFEVSAEAVESGYLELVYDSLEPITGRVVTADGDAQPDVRVRAVHTLTGEIVSGRATTGPEGEFEVQVDTSLQAEGAIPWLLEVGPTSETPWFATWRAEFRDVSFGPEMVTLTLPNLPAPVPIEVAVESEPEPDLYRKIGGAQVTFEGELTLLRSDGSETTATVSRTGQTSTEGASLGLLTVELLAGKYEVVAVPPTEESQLGPVVVPIFQVVERPPGGTQRGVTFLVPQRGSVEGTLNDSAGRALPNVSVRGRPLPASDDRAGVARHSRSNTTATDVDGRFDLPLDTGDYDLVFEPSEGSFYPWQVLPAERIEGAERLSRDVVLQAPVVLRGEVRFESGREPAGALVTAFAEIEDELHGARYLQIGRSVVLDDGSYALYLPASLSGSE